MSDRTRSPAVARIADRAGCQWPSRSSKVNDFHLIWNSVCNLAVSLAVSEIQPLKLKFFHCKIAAKPLQMETWGYYWQPIGCRQHAVRWYHRRPPYDLPLIVRWGPFTVIQCNRCSCHLKANMWLPISDQQQFRLYLAPFSQNTSVTDRRQPCHKFDCYLSTVG